MTDTLYERIPGGTIEALQLLDTPERRAELFDWTEEAFQPTNGVFGDKLWVKANHAQLDIVIGEWVAKDSLGFYPIKDEVFKKAWRQKPEVPAPAIDGMSSGDALSYLGTDGLKWAEEFTGIYSTGGIELDGEPGGLVHGWFANAIEAGISKGRELERAAREDENG